MYHHHHASHQGNLYVLDPRHHRSIESFVFYYLRRGVPNRLCPRFMTTVSPTYRQLSGASSRSTCEYETSFPRLGFGNFNFGGGIRKTLKQGHFDQGACNFECFGPFKPVDCINNERKSRSIHPDLSHRRAIQRQRVSNEFYIHYDRFINYLQWLTIRHFEQTPTKG